MSNKNKWYRVIQQGNKKYGYVLVDNKDKPVQFNSDSGYFKVYDSPNTQSHYYNTYLVPKNKPSNNIVNPKSPVQLNEVTVTAPKKPPIQVGIQITPNEAHLTEQKEKDQHINEENDKLQHFFGNLLTFGMQSPVTEGTEDIKNGDYVKGAAKVATPIMFGPTESTVANLTRLGVGAYDLANENGVRKTLKLANNGDWSRAAKSAAGDALNLGMTLGGGYNLGKYNIPSFVQQVARNGNNTARSYLISKELNQNVRNFDGTVGEEYFQNPVPYRWIRVSETPEVHGLQEMGKNVTTTDAYNIHVPSNDWRVSHIKDFIFKDGQWYKKPKKKFSLTKFGQAHGDASQAAYGKVWNGTFAYSRQFPRVRLEGEAYNKVYRGFDPNTGYDSRTNFVLQNVDDIPMGSRVGFHTGEMPMENLQYFQQLPDGRWAIKGQILPNKNLYINTPKVVEPTDNAFTFKMPNLAYSTSLNPSTNRPYYLQFGNNSGNMMIQDIKKGRNEFVNWMNNPKYRKAAEQNKQEATSMGLSYTPTYEKPQYSWMLKYGIKPEFKSKMEGEGATSWMGAQEGTPTSVEYNLSSRVPYDKVTRHEVGHVSLHGNGKNAEELKYLRYKTHQAFKDDAFVYPYDFHQQTGEAAMNGRDLGADLGISVGQEYPGYQKALDIINSNYKNSNKAGMVNVLKLDKESMPYVWKLLNGTLLGGTTFTTYNLNNNGQNK